MEFRRHLIAFCKIGGRRCYKKLHVFKSNINALHKTGNVTCKCNKEARSSNHCCRGKAKNITYSGCVSASWNVHAPCYICYLLACLAVPFFFPHYRINNMIFEKKISLLDIKCNMEILGVRNCTEFVDWVERNLVFIREFRVEILMQKDVILIVVFCFVLFCFVVVLHSYRQWSREYIKNVSICSLIIIPFNILQSDFLYNFCLKHFS